MFFIIIQFICLSTFFRSFIGSHFIETTNPNIIYGICILMAAAIILSYRIYQIGFVAKIAASACVAYYCVLIVNWFIKGFVQENNVLFADIIIFVIATICFSMVTISETELTWFDSDYDLSCFNPIIIIKSFFPTKNTTKKTYSLEEQIALNEINKYVSANISLRHENQELKAEIAHKNAIIKEFQSTLAMTKNDNDFLRAEVERIKSKGSDQDVYKDILFANCKNKQDIKERYRKLSTIFHPDCQNGDNDIFLKIKNTYEKIC